MAQIKYHISYLW